MPDTEHPSVNRSRSKFPELALEETNLRVACRSCNSSKGSKVLNGENFREPLTAPVDELQELIDAGFTDHEILIYLDEAKEIPRTVASLE